jgi:uncharacterized protein (TIGR02453 family)
MSGQSSFSGAFSGFPQAGLDFLAQLAENNNRPWFETHKATYQRALLEPALDFVSGLGSKLQTLDSDIHFDRRTDGGGSLMRIYRDTRFSGDKSPYKTRISGLFWRGVKKMGSPAFGFQIEPDGMGLMAGMFEFGSELLPVYRAAVDGEKSGQELATAVASVRESGPYEIGGEHYKRVPAGFPAAHPRGDLLRHNGLYTFLPMIPASQIQDAGLVDIAFEHCQKMAPIYHWLVKHIATNA